MYKDKKYFGIDISKDVFDVCDNNLNYYQFKNSVLGFKKLLKLLDKNFRVKRKRKIRVSRIINFAKKYTRNRR